MSAVSSNEKGRPLPKFGEWDVNNPASAEGFTVIFNKARDDKKTNANPAAMAVPPRNNNIGAYKPEENYDFQPESVCFILFLAPFPNSFELAFIYLLHVNVVAEKLVLLCLNDLLSKAMF
ncbi:hypothetical protein HPP92_011056 [Vanilla planifolia]|uniref:RIN4 pathogenic type III effector avirulence factor Avr cleavage site domain-containing protein n=1 Tax=Vanilla planifolia TaxID=51239 RepID=A0A835R5A1_VANPL|nr:hypothetical protein HPP92_011056 [Vanilla planifolia]